MGVFPCFLHPNEEVETTHARGRWEVPVGAPNSLDVSYDAFVRRPQPMLSAIYMFLHFSDRLRVRARLDRGP